jgi:muramoyltetrapeptide carboxypeptidase
VTAGAPRAGLPPLDRPRRLARGDRVAVVATSGPLLPERLARGVATLESWGLQVVVGGHALETRRHLAGTDEQRAADLHRAWCDPTVRAVVCGRGGSGAARVVDLLDWAAMQAAGPRVLVGFSDVTALHLAVANRLGLVSLMGPMAATEVFAGADPDARSVDGLRAALMDPQAARTLAAGTLQPVVGGTATGVLTGGTLAVLAQAAGTPDHRPATGGIAVLEDVGEPTYRLDALVTQLLRSGWFEGVRGIVLGTFEQCGVDAVEVLLERLRPLGVPLATGLAFGHGRPQLTVPLGVEADLDVGAGTLVLRQPALR